MDKELRGPKEDRVHKVLLALKEVKEPKVLKVVKG